MLQYCTVLHSISANAESAELNTALVQFLCLLIIAFCFACIIDPCIHLSN
jgi:hypothetical protein